MKNSLSRKWSLSLVIFAFLAFAGCEGTDSREAVEDTVEELSGKKNIDRMDRMKQDISDINTRQKDRLKEAE